MRSRILLLALALAATPVVNGAPSPAPAVMTIKDIKKYTIFAPIPEYPVEARRLHETGYAMVYFKVDPATGKVTQVYFHPPTGHPLLDQAMYSAFRRWVFKPHTARLLRTPVHFVMDSRH